MKRKTAILAMLIVAASGALMTGCATSPGGMSAELLESKLVVQYSDPVFEEQLSRVGLKDTFVEYWLAHGAKNWKRRYELEKFSKPLEEKFYVAYFAKAWVIRSILITDVNLDSPDPYVDMTLTVSDPETQQNVAQSLRDKWELTDGAWRHVVQDPMLSGFVQ